jgi:hypothetical protein
MEYLCPQCTSIDYDQLTGYPTIFYYWDGKGNGQIMALAPFFFRTYMAVGAHAGITRGELEMILSKRVVHVAVGDACDVDGNEKWISELLVNLLSRLYPVLSLTGPDQVCSRLSTLAKAINPEIEIVGAVESTVSVFVGAEVTTAHGFAASSSGWVARISSANAFRGGPANPYSSGAAAAFAAWRVFDVVVRQKDLSALSDVSLSLLDFSEDSGLTDSLPAIDVGEVAIVGVGAVGNPAIWALRRHAGITGQLHLVDPEQVDISNLQRYILPLYADRDKSKVLLAEAELVGSGLSVTPWQKHLHEFAEEFSAFDTLPTICISVDNVNDRRVAQALLPRMVINGWTSDSGLGTSWHRFSGEAACLGCLYHPTKPALSQTEMAAKALGLEVKHLGILWVNQTPLSSEDIAVVEAHLRCPGKLGAWVGKRVQDVYSGVICGQIGLDLPELDHVATVPLAHQSVLAGIFMAAELVKRSDPALESVSQRAPVVQWDQILEGTPWRWTTMRKKVCGCFCGDIEYQDAYSEKWREFRPD